jgi:hypothetical protein
VNCCYSNALAYSQVKSAKHTSNFTLGRNLINHGPVNVLSVSSEGLLLIGQYRDQSQLHVYNADCSYVTSIKLYTDKHVADAVWTRRGNIVYSEDGNGKVVTMSRSGHVMRQTAGFVFSHLSVSTDGVIYLIHKRKDVYHSTDDGLTWSHVFNVSDGCDFYQVIKVSTDSNTDVLWTSIGLRLDNRTKYHEVLRVYTVDNRRAVGDNVISQRDVAIPWQVRMDSSSKLVYDGHTSIFAKTSGNKAVHVWSVRGQYDRQLVSLQKLVSFFWCIAVDGQRHVMYVGHDQGRVDVFELTYEPL